MRLESVLLAPPRVIERIETLPLLSEIEGEEEDEGPLKKRPFKFKSGSLGG